MPPQLPFWGDVSPYFRCYAACLLLTVRTEARGRPRRSTGRPPKRRSASCLFDFGEPYTPTVTDHEPNLAALHADRRTRMIQHHFSRVPASEVPQAPLFGLDLRRPTLNEVKLTIRLKRQVIPLVVCRLPIGVLRFLNVASHEGIPCDFKPKELTNCATGFQPAETHPGAPKPCRPLVCPVM